MQPTEKNWRKGPAEISHFPRRETRTKNYAKRMRRTPREISGSPYCPSPSCLRRQPRPDSSFEMGFPQFPIWQQIENKLVILGLRRRQGRKEFPKWYSGFSAKIATILIYE